jgi:predicted PurR-regulated permease PerM
MAFPVETQLKYWGIAAAVLMGALWLFGDILLPFLIGGAIAYLLDPVADWLERAASVTLITLLAVFMFAAMILLVVPLLVDQSTALIKNAPTLIQSFITFLTERFPGILEEGSRLRTSLASLGETIQSRGGELLNGVLSSFTGIVNIFVLVFFVPVVAFYLLLDWDKMIAKIDDMLPRDHAPTIRRLASEIDSTLAAFVRGQGTVCLIQGTFYAAALMAVGLQFGLFVGFIAGLISFIPYVGALFGGALALGLAVFQFWGDWVWIAAVGAIFMFGQVIEGNVLTPKLVGESVGLHPVLLIFSLSAFGSLFGFVGLLVAVPVSASLGVIARFLFSKYKDGRLYQGLAINDEASDD